MNCLKCPYVKKNDTKIYCPFFSLEDCPLMGKHYIPGQAPKNKPAQEATKKVAEKVVSGKTQPSYIPTYKPMHKTGTGGVIPWESLHKRIFEAIHNSKGIKEIAKAIGVTHSTLRSYLRRYDYEKEK